MDVSKCWGVDGVIDSTEYRKFCMCDGGWYFNGWYGALNKEEWWIETIWIDEWLYNRLLEITLGITKATTTEALGQCDMQQSTTKGERYELLIVVWNNNEPKEEVEEEWRKSDEDTDKSDEEPAPKKRRRKSGGKKKKDEDDNDNEDNEGEDDSDDRPQATTNFPSDLFAKYQTLMRDAQENTTTTAGREP